VTGIDCLVPHRGAGPSSRDGPSLDLETIGPVGNDPLQDLEVES
jgi:hypothetical protein